MNTIDNSALAQVCKKVWPVTIVILLMTALDQDGRSTAGGVAAATAAHDWKAGLKPVHYHHTGVSSLDGPLAGGGLGRTLLSTGSLVMDGDCENFKLVFDNGDVDFYTCCEGRMNVTETVPNWNCHPSKAGERKDGAQYICGGLEGEALARERCDTRWAWIASESCFYWPVCFQGACSVWDGLNSSITPIPFCGDGNCDTASSESTKSCPADCCPRVSNKCLVANNECPKPCCNEAACCRDTGLFCWEKVWVIVASCGIMAANIILWCTFACCCSSKQYRCFLTGPGPR